MKFFKGKEATRVRAIRGVRAKYMHPTENVVEVQFLTPDGKMKLTLELTPEQVYGLINDLSSAYEAIAPPLTRRGAGVFDWMNE